MDHERRRCIASVCVGCQHRAGREGCQAALPVIGGQEVNYLLRHITNVDVEVSGVLAFFAGAAVAGPLDILLDFATSCFETSPCSRGAAGMSEALDFFFVILAML